jgi:Fe-S-cluster formation regulator IscX/YfhJ
MKLEIKNVRIRDRLREDLGDLNGLAESIRTHGLIHPIVVDEEGVLVAGGRRLAACKSLGHSVIEARRFGELTKQERRVLELEENLHRKDLTAFERSKCTVEVVELAKEEARNGVATNGVTGGHRQKLGRPPEPDSTSSASDRVGIPRKTIVDAEQHVAIAERYPMLQAPDWSQRAAVKVGKMLDQLPAKDRRRAVSICEQSQAHATAAEKIISTWSGIENPARERVWDAVSSSDKRERSLALTTLADVAPDIDPRILIATEIAKSWRRAAAQFKDDPINDRLLKESERAEEIAEKLREQHKALVAKFSKELMR